MIALDFQYGKLWRMNDESIFRATLVSLRCAAAAAVVLAAPAWAGEEVLYGAAPAWVEAAPLEKLDLKKAPSTLLYDWQHRLEDGVVTSYEDNAIRIDNPDTLMNSGTISIAWLPDKGDLTIHRVEILRGGKTIDVIAGGAEFDVIRREQGLEQRLLDGELTATLAVPGLEIGDILRVTHSITLADQALGAEMQASQNLWAKPWQVGFSRAIVSWPESADIYWGAEKHAGVSAPVLDNGYRKLTVTLPIEKAPDMPSDAPSRFSRDAILRVGTFADWQELSRAFAPHYLKAAQVADDSPVAAEARRIMGASNDPLTRAAMALRLVQDDVSYLLNGLDGGNYMPQSAELTWEKRYGDCKAKSVLLFSLLGRMGIDAEPVLVSTRGGDALPELLPIPGNFDHMIIRAKIGGTDYWLDGTSTATRLANIAEVPAFFHALPLTADGADLVPMTQRELPAPQMVMSIVSDYSAGVDLPPLFDMTMKIYGAQGAGFRVMADEADEDKLKELAKSFAASAGDGSAVTDITIDYDDELAAGILKVKGVMASDFRWKEGRLQLEDNSADLVFNPDRARGEWQNIPVLTGGPSRVRIEGTSLLPDHMPDFRLSGATEIDERFANTHVVSSAKLLGNRMVGWVEVTEKLGEIAPADVAKEKLAVRRINGIKSELVAPDNVVWRWELAPEDLAKLARPIAEAYDKAVAFAAEDDNGPLLQRASFRADIYDWKGMLADIDALIAKEASADLHFWRANALVSLDRPEEAIAAARTAYELDPANETAFYLAELLAYQGRQGEALELLESLPVTDEEKGSYASYFATVAGLAGKTDAALGLLAEEVAAKPTNASVLNADCWFRGLFDVNIEGALPVCTKAIERATNSAPMLDSRAMVSYRMGNYEAALKDLDSALELAPGLSASMYLRGIIRLEQGDKAGREDVETALRMSPELAERYARHGVAPKK